MTTKVKDFVASTARYARKAALAADKNKNSKLTKTEAKSLPSDLQDDFKRQAKNKATVTTASFAKDQTAYVAAAARKVDKNKNGSISPSESKALPKDLQDNFASYKARGASGSDATASSSPFIGAGKGTKQKLGGVAASRMSLSPAVDSLLVTLSNQGGSQVYAAAWKLTPTALADALAHPEKHPDFMNELLFESTGTGYQRDYGDYYNAAGLSESSTTAAAAAKEIADDLRQTPDTGIAATTKGLTDLMDAPGVTFERLFWTNGDDADFMGLMAFNTKTGEITSFGWFNEP